MSRPDGVGGAVAIAVAVSAPFSSISFFVSLSPCNSSVALDKRDELALN